MSSSFTLSLKSFNSDQYLALTDEDAFKTFVFIDSLDLFALQNYKLILKLQILELKNACKARIGNEYE